MKMKSTLAVTVISLACLFALFHSCHGIVCYSCDSENYTNKACENVSGDEYVVDYGTEADCCIKMVIHRKPNGTNASNHLSNRLLHRYGYLESSLPILRDEVKELRSKREHVEYYFCRTDKCNFD